MDLTEQPTETDIGNLGLSAKEFIAYCNAERERRLNSGEAFDQQAFDAAVELVLRKLHALAEEGWT